MTAASAVRQMNADRVRTLFRPVHDEGEVAALWRGLEARSDAGFFQSWTWVGCLWSERFRDAVLATVLDADEVIGLALLGGRRGELWLDETGDPALDVVYAEQHGGLAARGREADAIDALYRSLAQPSGLGWQRLHCRRVGIGHLEHASRYHSRLRVVDRQASPIVELEHVRASPGDYTEILGPNLRTQLRRSMRLFEDAGPLKLERAGHEGQVEEYFELLQELHQRSWQRRGKPGAFADPFFVRFHRTLLADAVPRQRAELLKISAGDRVVGVLYNFLSGGRVYAYQSGFAYGPTPRHKPGLVSHYLAIKAHSAEGRSVYDFLAGDQRYKREFASEHQALISFTLHVRRLDYWASRVVDRVRSARHP